MRFAQALFILLLLGSIHTNLVAQFAPIALTGFNQDVIAEGGPNSLVTTTSRLDAAASNKIMYNNAFRTFAALGGGGLPDNGTITSGIDIYQLANYTGNNALFVYRNETQTISLATPSVLGRIRIVAFSTEGNSLLNISLNFSDATSTPYLTNYSIADWFTGTTNIVVQGFGRCDRNAAPPYNAEGYTTNPRFYYIDIPLNCTDRAKQLQSVTFNNVSTTGGAAPFPNAVIMAISGVAFSQNISPVITPSDCSGPNGSIALTVTGSSSPYSYAWNTTPAQTGATATGLAPGTYSCTITDAAGCPATYTGTVTLNNNAAITATANPTAVCPGMPVTLTANATTGILTSFTWMPGNLTGATITVNPTATGPYTVTATNSLGCTASTTVNITVNSTPAAPTVNGTAVCPGGTATLQVQSPQAGFVYRWYDAATGGTLLNTGTSYTVTNAQVAATYYVEAENTSGCISASRTAVSILLNVVPAAPTALGATVCTGTNATVTITNPQAGYTYNWYDAATAGNLLGSSTSYTISNVTVPVTVYVAAVNTTSCNSATRTAVTASVLQQLATPVVTLTTTTFTSLTFSWVAVPGATGYQVTTNGGTSYQLPSSGANGTTHTISGLVGNTTVILQVRAIKNAPCETSNLSASVTGTTLSSKEIFVPNVFTPNGDGKNDKLLVYGNYVSTIRFQVFNQWGQLVFVSENMSTGWDGYFKGQLSPVGVYAYTLKVVLQDGTIVNKKGAVNLIR